MSQLTNRLERDLREIAADARPSPSAWESIVARLGDDGESGDAFVLAPAPDRSKRPVWVAVAAAALVLITGSIAVLVSRAGDDDSISTVDPDATTNPSVAPPSTVTDVVPTIPPTPAPFVGIWVSTDTDGSSQTMEIVRSGGEAYEFVLRDDVASIACSGAPATMTGTGLLETDDTLVIAQPELTCDDGTIPVIGPPPQAELASFTFDRDAVADELTDRFGVVWRRPGSTRTGNTASPTTSVEPAAAAATLAERQALLEKLIDAVRGAVIDDADGLTIVRDLFTEDATIRAFSNWEQSPVTEPGLLERWILQLRTWGFDGAEAYRDSCLASEDSEGTVYCSVRARWATLLAEADETWEIEFVGDQIQTLLVPAWGGVERSAVTLPLAVADLAYWEQWLRETDPETAARLVPTVEFEEEPVVTRYDPAVAAEIHASIQAYVENRPPGDEISVTADRVEVGDRLVTVSMARADGRTYVLAGRYQTGRDLETSTAEQAVLAAFDDLGRELWRTELGGRPRAIAVVDDAVWVDSNPDSGVSETLTRIGSSDGRMLGQVAIGSMWDPDGAFGSLWVQEWGGQLIRVNPDLSTTTVEGPFPDLTNGCDYCPQGATAGSDAIWVPLGNLGVAVIDPVTNQVTTIPRDEIGHDVLKVAFDGDVTYVASRNQVTSIVDGHVRATVTVGEIMYLGPIDGVIGAQLPDGQFAVLRANDPMVVERRQTSLSAWSEIDGEAWAHVWNGRKPDFRRVELLPVPAGNG